MGKDVYITDVRPCQFYSVLRFLVLFETAVRTPHKEGIPMFSM
jgi:hypothetical protein